MIWFATLFCAASSVCPGIPPTGMRMAMAHPDKATCESQTAVLVRSQPNIRLECRGYTRSISANGNPILERDDGVRTFEMTNQPAP